MKKTFQVNINGKIFHIDEDAYQLLQNYLAELRSAFPGEEGEEIVSDIECRIAEHFDQRITCGFTVIVLEDVNRVITVMGRPEELAGEEIYVESAEEPLSDTTSGSATPPAAPAPQEDREGAVPPPFHKKLFRDVRHKVFGGVLAGLGQYLGWDVTVLRILTVIVTVFIGRWDLFWPMIGAYLVAWMVIPPARTPRQILEMRGEPVTVDTVGQTVIDSTVPPVAPIPNEGNEFVRFINNLFLIIGRALLVILGIAGAALGVCMLILSLVVVAGILCYYFGNIPSLLETFDISLTTPYLMGWGMVLLFLSIMIPALSLGWAGLSTLFKGPRIPGSLWIGLAVIDVLFIVACAILLNLAV